MRTSVDYLSDPVIARMVAARRVARWREWSAKHGLVMWYPSRQFCIAHGVDEDEYITKELLEKAEMAYK